MITLENIRQTAKRAADREDVPMTIWNLNVYTPLYVVRLARPGDAERHGYVETVMPTGREDEAPGYRYRPVLPHHTDRLGTYRKPRR
jgi:hypothetical protein